MQALPIIREYVNSHLLQRGGPPPDNDASLIEEGYLTSLEAVDLVVFLESQFEIEVDPEDVNEEQFRSLRTIAELVERKQAGRQEARP